MTHDGKFPRTLLCSDLSCLGRMRFQFFEHVGERPYDLVLYKPKRAEWRRQNKELQEWHRNGGLALVTRAVSKEHQERIRARLKEGARQLGMNEADFAKLVSAGARQVLERDRLAAEGADEN